MSKLGVIFTDTAVLADKYNCHRQEVIDVIGNYIHGCRDRGIDWQLVDVGGHDFDYIFSEDVSWQGYCRALADNCTGMGWHTDYNTPLLIIGGDDVIPVPIVDFFVPDDQKTVNLHVDLFYAYPPDFKMNRELEAWQDTDYSKGELYSYFLSKSVFNVSRLPLETGELHGCVQHDLGMYFDKVANTNGCVVVDNIVPTTGYSWYISMKGATEGLPLLPLGRDNGCHLSDIFISPLLRMKDSASMVEYKQSLAKADMLLQFLHGSNHPDAPGFYGQGPRPNKSWDEQDDSELSEYGERPQAFDPTLLPFCNTTVFNTSACFGARYIGYQRNQSMLLSALYKSSILLYMGSCESAYSSLPIFSQSSDVSLTGISNSMIKTYLNLQLQGEPAGLAMLKAKLHYIDENWPTEGWLCPYTIYEFNQYGDPTVKIRSQRYNRINSQPVVARMGVGYEHREKVTALKEDYKTVYSSTSLELLDREYRDVRNSVDAALMSLSDNLRHMLDQDYHYPSQHMFLTSVLRDKKTGGHLFVYAHEGYSDSTHDVYIRVDATGKVKNIICKM